MITIRSINGEVLTHFDNDVPNGNPYFEPVMTDDMESLVSSFSFSVPLQLADTEYLTGMNQVLTYDRQGDLRLFIISDVYEDWNTTNGVVKVDCEDVSITEMNNIVVNPFEAKDFNEALTKTFKNSGWKFKFAANWKEVIHDTFILEDYTNMRDVLAQLKDTYECQFKFMAQENEYGEITRVVEVFKSVGNDNGKYFYYNRDLLGIERDISFTDVKTAIHPYYVGYDGKVYTLSNFAPAHPDPDFSKDKESPLIVNKAAHAEYDDGNSYRIMPYKTEVQGDPELVYREAIEELKKHAEPIYTYTVNALLLQNMIEWEGEDIDLGDTVWMKERVGNRELGLEARVVAYEYHEDDPSADKVTFSNFKEIDTRDVEELSNRIFFAYANSADGHLDFSIDDSVGKSYMGVYTSTVTQQSTDPDTYKWTKIKGEDGNSAPTLSLTASQQVMKFKPDGTPDGDQSILFTALKQNSTEAVEWEAIPYKGEAEQSAITLEGTGDTRTLSSANWDKTWSRVQVTVTMGALKDIQTVVQVADGATGASGKAIVGFVTNESTTFAASTDGTVSDYTQGNGKFVIYEGTKEVTSGVLYAKESNVGINLVIDATTGEYTVANMTQDQAQASVKATYEGVTITKFLSFAKSKQGAKGDKGDTGRDGIAGKDGVGLRSTAVTYAASTSGTTSPATGWQEQVPTVAPDNFLWTRTVWTYSDGTSETGYSVAKMGKDGAKGDDGIAGKDGVGIADTLIEYAVSTNGTTKPTSGWSTTIPTTPQGQYLWTRTTWTYTDKTTEQGFTVARQGEKGAKGDQGIAGPKGADGRTQYTHIAYADTASGGGFSQNPTGKAYIGMYVDFEELDSSDTTRYAWSLIKGADGEQGVAGPKGEDGRTPYFHTAYTNSTDFGSYDYSGNPNLMVPLKASDFYPQSGATIEDYRDALKVTFTKTDGDVFLGTSKNIPALLPNTQYTLSADVTVSEGYTGKLENLRLCYRKSPNGTTILLLTGKEAIVGQKTRISITANSSSATDPSIFDKMYFTINTTSTEPFVGTVLIENIKVERGSTSTPYQPNLLDAPHYFSKVVLGENIASKTVTFPIKSSGFNIYVGDTKEDLVIGQTYTITLKGTKPASQTFAAFNRWDVKFGDLKPVEGLTNVWSLTFTPTKLVPDFPKNFRIYQSPEATAGACQIDWLKIEKGDTRTPNIDYYKYLGNYTDFVQADSLNPTKYSWSLIKGADGKDGKDGAPAKLLSLQADSYVMKFDTNGNIISGQTISLSAIVQNMSGTTTWLATPYIGTAAQPPLTLTGSGNTRTLSESLWGKTVTKVVVKVTLGDFEDTIIINKLQDGAKGQDGADGRDGIAGKDGVGLKSTAITYAGSANGTTPPSTGWQTQVPTVPAGQFLWTRTIWTYTDNSNETGYSVAKMGQDGAKGNDGIAGKDGVGIKTTLVEYAVSTSGTTKPASGWSTSIPTVPQGQYLWTRTTWTYTDNTTEQGFTVARQGSNGANGTNGTNGANAISAFLSNETVSLPANAAGVVSSFATAKGTMMVYEGLNRVTSGVTFALGANNNTTATVDASGNFAVTAMTADSATVVINATYKGQTISKTFSLSKAKQGVQGVQGTMGIAFYSPTEPTGATVTDGATWFKTKSATDDTVIGIYTRKSGAWKQTPLASGTLAVEQLSAISANIGNVTAGNLTGVKITGASFINPFDFTDQTNNHIQGTTEISNSELDISGTANAGAAGERKFHTTVAPLYFEATYSDAADNLIRSLNMSSSGFILNEVGNRVTTSLSSGQFQSIDSANGKSVITSTNNISITDSKNTAVMSPSGFVFRNRKNIHLWQGTGTVLKNMPNLGRITFGTYQSVGWGMLNEDIPLRVHNNYTWQATRKIKIEMIAQLNTQDPTADWVYFTAQSAMTTDTDKSPRQTITIGRISATKDSGDIRIPLQNTTLCTGYFELNEGEYLSLCGNCREGKHCGNVTGMSIAFREIFST